jgi:hypothetical protein
MWEPVGPLPATVYWRRRAAAALGTVAVLGLLVWTVVSIAVPARETTIRAASRAAVSAPQPTTPPPASAPTPASTPGAGASPGGESNPIVVPSSAAGPATAERLQPDDSPRLALPAPPPIPVPATGPVPCSDEMIGVAAEIDPAEHRVGQRPTLRLVVTNISKQPCVRDLDSGRQEIVVWSMGGDRLWSSNDCAGGSAADLRTLVPGQPVAFAVAWAGRSSSPGCAGSRTVVPAGKYRVMSRVDGVISPPTEFQRLA